MLGGEETFLLSTDGLHGALDPDTMAVDHARTGEPPAAAAALVKEALQRGSTDNITALVVKYVP